MLLIVFNLHLVSGGWSWVPFCMLISHLPFIFYELALTKAWTAHSATQMALLEDAPIPSMSAQKLSYQPQFGDPISWRESTSQRSHSLPGNTHIQLPISKGPKDFNPFAIHLATPTPELPVQPFVVLIVNQLHLCRPASFSSPMGIGPGNTPQWAFYTLFSISNSASRITQHTTLTILFLHWAYGPFLNDLKVLCLE